MSKDNKIDVFSQIASRRIFVGNIWRERGLFHFAYDKKYRRLKKSVALGPEFPLWKESFSSKKFFPSLADRIPSRENPAYEDYCRQWGISAKEDDPLVLLTAIGRRGPSTFVFERTPRSYSAEKLKNFRERIGLNQRDFALLFGTTQATLTKLETGKGQNAFMMTFFMLCDEESTALRWLLRERGQCIHDDKRTFIERLLDKMRKT